MEFKPLTKENKSAYEAIYRAYPRLGADASFTTPFAWAGSFQTKLFLGEDALCMEGTSRTGLPYYMMPLSSPPQMRLLQRLYDRCHALGIPFTLRWLQKEDLPVLESLFPGKFSVQSPRDAAEYIYETSALLTLSGKKLHAKRNHVNAFRAAYAYEIRHLSEENLSEALGFVLDHSNTADEKMAMERLFSVYTDFSLKGMLLYVDGTLVGVTVGEEIGGETALIHLEKADTAFTGAYAMVNQLFVQNYFAHTRYINREEDMGIEGLRKAKLSYRPAFLLEKFTVSEA